MEIARKRTPSPAMVVALISLFVALTGVGYAATQLDKNSVKSKHVKDNALKGKDIRDDNLTGADIDESSLTGIPVSGTAGGGLAGSYPNPTIASNAVGSAQIANDAVNSAKVAANTLTAADLAPDSVGASELEDHLSAFESARNAGTVNLGVGAANITTTVAEGGTSTANIGQDAIVIGKVNVDNSAAAVREVECRLVAPDATVLDEVDAVQGSLNATGTGDDEVFTLMGFDTLLGGDYLLRCFAFSGAAGEVDATNSSIAILPAAAGEA